MDDDSDATNSLNPRRASPFVTALALRFPLLGGGISESDLRIEKLTLVVSKETGDLSPIIRPNIKCIGEGPRNWHPCIFSFFSFHLHHANTLVSSCFFFALQVRKQKARGV
jgi:hypothetical protein